MQKLLISGTDTSVGKTWVTALLARQGTAQGQIVGVYKPVCSGADPGSGPTPVWDDLRVLSAAVGDRWPVDDICPQRFLAPVAPPEAARREGRQVDSRRLRGGATRWGGRCDVLLIEGAGGLLCPLADDTTVADLAQDLQAPVLIVAANRLGVINHTLLTVEVLRSRQLVPAGVVLNDTRDPLPVSPDHPPDESLSGNATQLRHWLPDDIPLFRCAFRGKQLLPIGGATGPLCEPLRQLCSGDRLAGDPVRPNS